MGAAAGAGVGMFGLLFLAIGALIIFFGRRFKNKGEATRQWPQVPGRILTSLVTNRRSGVGETYQERNQIDYEPSVTYEYAVNGQAFQGNRLGFGRFQYRTERRAREILAPFPVNAQVPVFYDPQQPQSSVLRQGAPKGSALLYGLGGCFALIGAGIILFGILMAVLVHRPA